MSQFSDVDSATDIARIEAYLDLTASRLTAMKRYMVGAHVAAGSTRVLDLGCGAGHDLELLDGAGIVGFGLDASGELLRAAQRRLPNALLVRARGEAVPVRGASVDGCRIERVLQHVSDPEVMVREAIRCLRPGGLLTVFEPDWTSLRIVSDRFDHDASWLVGVRWPDIGARLARLIERNGADVADVVEERSVWRSLDWVGRTINFPAGMQRHVEDGGFTTADAAAWFAEQQARDRDGDFHMTLSKVLVVARTR